MRTDTWLDRQRQLKTYFDHTAVKAWEQLTSDTPVSRIRETVRAGRRRMRDTLLDWLPRDLAGKRLLDAGCGTGSLAMAAARRGATVTAIDISPTLIALARERTPVKVAHLIEYRSGDMLASGDDAFDVIVAMDSLIHYSPDDMLLALARLGDRLSGDDARLLFTFAPYTPMLAAMHRVGQWFPRADRSPAIVPVSGRRLRETIAVSDAHASLVAGRSRRIRSGFYTSEALELRRR